MRPRTPSPARAGFTLLELMLAMTALALVAAICYGAFHLGIRAVEKGEMAVVTTQRLRVASDVLIRQIKSTVAYPARNEDEEVYPYFMGSATSMTFITAAGLQGGGGLTRVVYQVVDDPPRLMITESPFFSPDALGRDPVDKPGETGTTLLDNFTTLKFEYLMNDGVETEWRPAWDAHEDEMLPQAVRVMVEGLPGLEMNSWGQEIPIMATTYGENTGEVDEEDLDATGGGTGANPDDGTDDGPGTGAGGGDAAGADGGDE
jgi:prepilin-type N-terminal cleavage/methylation domain-containing protein